MVATYFVASLHPIAHFGALDTTNGMILDPKKRG
jgi:hypothetical protein